MHVRTGGGAHHARRVHLDRLQVHCADLHAAAPLRFADGIFSRLGERVSSRDVMASVAGMRIGEPPEAVKDGAKIALALPE